MNHTELKIAHEKFPNENILEFHTNQVLTPKIYSSGGLDDFELFWEHNEYEVGIPKVKTLLKKIEEVPGIKGLSYIKKYSLRLHKANLFDWKDISPQVDLLITEHLKQNHGK